MAPGAEVADGLFDVVRAGPLGRAALIAAFGRIFSGTHTDLDEVWTRQVDHVEFPGNEIVVHVEEPIPTDGMTAKDVPALRDQVRDVISTRVEAHWS
jgi:diacylglycerol kinase family enzyme